MKRLHRLIMLSSAYQQASEHNEQAASVDAGNRLLWRMNRRRMEAEVVRDSVLAVSGGLDSTMGGPADMTFRYQFRKSPIYDYFSPEESPQTTRRSVYNFIARSTPDPFLDAFDFPVPTECAPARSSTTTPLQSLSLLNDPFLLRESERFAKRLESSDPDDVQSQVTAAYRSAFGREPTAGERERAAKFVRERTLFHFCRAMLNANEFVYVD